VPQYNKVHRLVGHHSVSASGFLFQLLQALRLTYFQPAVFGRPVAIRCRADAVLPA
jgi:hypothetical protein